ncbi:hypothetical protein C8J47_0155 [Sphingomonas sp. PP-F2F-G114-C0414]|nr:hypothetical protein C8J47_0155 [Sphingomonas sp. PP-F2F-G114-C0414]
MGALRALAELAHSQDSGCCLVLWTNLVMKGHEDGG